MIILSQDKFAQKCPEHKNKSDIIFHKKHYKRSITFSLDYYNKAVEYCQELETNNYSSLLIKNAFGYTIWFHKEETLDQDKLILDNHLDVSHENQKNQEEESPKKNHNFATKIVKRLYRGTSYEVELPLEASKENKPTSVPNKKRRKYRGSYY